VTGGAGQSMTPGRPTWSSRGARANDAVQERPSPPVKTRLPLPKNVVLLSLIEATELASDHVERHNTTSPRGSQDDDGKVSSPKIRPPPVHAMNSMVDAENEEEERIKESTSLAVGAAGTYAVAHKEGMEIFSSRPSSPSRAQMDTSISTGNNDEDVDTLVQAMDQRAPTKNSAGPKLQARLSYGDRVQVVSIDCGWAKLARGYGYVQADKNQLVKGAYYMQVSKVFPC
jgi:hypothetical protein